MIVICFMPQNYKIIMNADTRRYSQIIRIQLASSFASANPQCAMPQCYEIRYEDLLSPKRLRDEVRVSLRDDDMWRR